MVTCDYQTHTSFLWGKIAQMYLQKQPSDVEKVLKNFAKFTGQLLCQSLFFNKVAGLSLATLLKKRLRHRCFPVNFAEFHLFTSGQLLLYLDLWPVFLRSLCLPHVYFVFHRFILFYSWRYTNADLKITLYVCVHIKTIP